LNFLKAYIKGVKVELSPFFLAAIGAFKKETLRNAGFPFIGRMVPGGFIT